jgi:hypothetical protein
MEWSGLSQGSVMVSLMLTNLTNKRSDLYFKPIHHNAKNHPRFPLDYNITFDRRQCVRGNSQGRSYRKSARTTTQAMRSKKGRLRSGLGGHGILNHVTSLRHG